MDMDIFWHIRYNARCLALKKSLAATIATVNTSASLAYNPGGVHGSLLWTVVW
jgi:hypothetical protein